MSPNARDLLKKVRQLPEAEQWDFLDQLLEVLEPPVGLKLDETGWVEIRRRSKEFDEGRVQGIPWSEVKDRVRKEFEGHE